MCLWDLIMCVWGSNYVCLGSNYVCLDLIMCVWDLIMCLCHLQLILNAKCHAIRDAQILEKGQISKELVDEEKRLDTMMEVTVCLSVWLPVCHSVYLSACLSPNFVLSACVALCLCICPFFCLCAIQSNNNKNQHTAVIKVPRQRLEEVCRKPVLGVLKTNVYSALGRQALIVFLA